MFCSLSVHATKDSKQFGNGSMLEQLECWLVIGSVNWN